MPLSRGVRKDLAQGLGLAGEYVFRLEAVGEQDKSMIGSLSHLVWGCGHMGSTAA